MASESRTSLTASEALPLATTDKMTEISTSVQDMTEIADAHTVAQDKADDVEALPAYSLCQESQGNSVTPDIEKAILETGAAVSSTDDNAVDSTNGNAEFIVWWQEPVEQDSENPQNWTSRRKWSIITMLSFITFLTPLASSMLAPGVPQLLAEFGDTSDTDATFVVSIFVLGFAFGPLVIAPMSEIYGRLIVYHICNSLFVVFTILCAIAKDINALLAYRFCAGFAGVAVVTCGGGSIADLMPTEKRAGAMAIWSLGPLLGPVIGPVAAGFLVEAANWRWVFWVIAIAAGLATFLSFFVLRETYAPVILLKKAARLRKETGDSRYRSKLDSLESHKAIFIKAIVRPIRMFCRAPVVAATCTYIAVMYGLLYILFTTFTFVYRDIYGFSSIGAGLSFVAAGLGNVVGVAYTGILSDKIVKHMKAQGRVSTAEDRLHFLLTVPASLLLPVGLIIYGWTADKHVHWIVPMIGTGVMGVGMIGIMMCVQTYLVDAYTVHAASVMAANSVLRSTLGALLPLCGLQLYDAIGLGWGNTLLGGIALVLAPILWLLRIYGERIRKNPRFQVEF
ncbi:hypothetical protein SBRCBS47491_000669 [Sporothrix bragantina]|uniref:Major facilitator superfamily (MFS) profile domain-containing protein n=1 Tax=Sporothrix bragantina TaxID=671064 RepID=A0ABP0ASB5_9PEZI